MDTALASRLLWVPCVLATSGVLPIGCGDDSATDGGRPDAGARLDAASPHPVQPAPLPAQTVTFPGAGPVAGAAGVGSFTFGAATAATQIEDLNPNTQWDVWTRPESEDGLGRGRDEVGEASRGFSLALEDVALLTELGLDAYRFSPSWSRIEPARGVIQEDALEHYDTVLDALVAAGIKPMITVHHFSSPVWIDDPRRGVECPEGPSDNDLCGFHNEGAGLIIEEAAEYARLLAERYGDRVDEWATVNEPVNYLLAGYGLTVFPPGHNLLLEDFDRFLLAVRNYLRFHAAIFAAIEEFDTVDADGDGEAALTGATLSVATWLPTRRNRYSERTEDIAAAERLTYVYQYLWPDSVRAGTFDADLDGTPDESHPEWANTLEWLGLQYYFRAGATAMPGLIPVVEVTPCITEFDFGACYADQDTSHVVEAMGYEYWEPGIYEILRAFSDRYRGLPLTVTESGLATEVGTRRAEHIVRSLEWIAHARDEGVDVRGYYHWSLIDNFEWAEGYTPRFGLYRVDFGGTYLRTPTEGATVLRDIATARTLTREMRERFGGLGPMSPEP